MVVVGGGGGGGGGGVVVAVVVMAGPPGGPPGGPQEAPRRPPGGPQEAPQDAPIFCATSSQNSHGEACQENFPEVRHARNAMTSHRKKEKLKRVELLPPSIWILGGLLPPIGPPRSDLRGGVGEG